MLVECLTLRNELFNFHVLNHLVQLDLESLFKKARSSNFISISLADAKPEVSQLSWPKSLVRSLYKPHNSEDQRNFIRIRIRIVY